MNKALRIILIIAAVLVLLYIVQGGTEVIEEDPTNPQESEVSTNNPYFSGYGKTTTELFSYKYPGYQENEYWRINNWPPEVLETTKEECPKGKEGNSMFGVITGYQGEYCLTITTTEENNETVQTYTLRGQSASNIYLELGSTMVHLQNCGQLGDKETECIQTQSHVQPEQFIEILMAIIDSVERV